MSPKTLSHRGGMRGQSRGKVRGRGRGRGRGSGSGRGRGRGRGRGISRKRGRSITHRSLSPSTTTADDSDADGTSTDGNVSLNQTLSPLPSPTRKNLEDYNEERELSLPRLKHTVLPENSTLQSLLKHGENSYYVMTEDELDHIQWELEAMLTTATVRQNTIRDELGTFASMQFARSLHKLSKNPKLPTIRPRAAAEISPVNECRKINVEFDPTSKELPPSKTESANKFWSLVEPYLAHVTKDDLNWLEDLVKSYDSNKKLYDIPPLGEHYAKNWAKEELEMQKSQSSCSPRPVKKLKLSERISPDVVELVNKANTAAHDGSVYVPIYQRVIASIAEHSHTSVEDIEEHFLDFDDEDKPQEMSTICKEFYAELSAKKQLYKLGLMGRHSKPVSPSIEGHPVFDKSDEDCDEILNEMVKCGETLAQLREMNRSHLTTLLERCHIDYRQQIIKNKLEKVNNEILNFKRHQNESWAKEKKIAQISEEDEELNYLLNQRSNYLRQIQSIVFEPNNSYLSPSVSDDSESSSDEESDPSKIHIKTEPSEHDTDGKENITIKNECLTEENVNIKHEIIEERMDYEEVNDDNVIDFEYGKHVVNGETVNEEIDKSENEDMEAENTDIDKNNQDDQHKLETNVQVKTQDLINEEESGSSSSTIKSNIKHRRKPKKSTSENDQTTEIDSKDQIKIKREPVDYELELDPSEDIVDGIKRELRPRKLNESSIYFEPFDGPSSEESDFVDLSD